MKEVIVSQAAEDFQKNKLQILAERTKIRQICYEPESCCLKNTAVALSREWLVWS